MPLSLILLLQFHVFAATVADSPVEIEVAGDFASFTHRGHTDNRMGYRFHEHTPLVYGDVPPAGEEARKVNTLAEKEAARFKKRPGMKVYRKRVHEEGWVPQSWTFYLAPVQDGADMLFLVETEDVGLPEFYAVQQCFRLSGATNAEWRQKYARTPAFSEYDLWAKAPQDASKTSLAWVLRGGTLQQLPACKETVGCRTADGIDFDTRRSGGHLDTLKEVGPYKARMLENCDNGLILRTSQDGGWSTGLYWERTTHLTDHHPADCLHAIVNIGGIPPHAKRALHGKIYWLKGGGEELVKHCKHDFGGKE